MAVTRLGFCGSSAAYAGFAPKIEADLSAAGDIHARVGVLSTGEIGYQHAGCNAGGNWINRLATKVRDYGAVIRQGDGGGCGHPVEAHG